MASLHKALPLALALSVLAHARALSLLSGGRASSLQLSQARGLRARVRAAEAPGGGPDAALSEYEPPPELNLSDVVGFWELEEAEDDCTAHTLVHLLPGGGLALGKTDGPIPSSMSGSWAVMDTEALELEMRVKRSFEEARFPYDVERVYSGFLTRDGPLVLLGGPIRIRKGGDAMDEWLAGGPPDAHAKLATSTGWKESSDIEAGFFQLTKGARVLPRGQRCDPSGCAPVRHPGASSRRRGRVRKPRLTLQPPALPACCSPVRSARRLSRGRRDGGQQVRGN